MSILFLKGKIAALDDDNNFYEAIGINGNTIDFLGTNERAFELWDKYDEVIDLEGHTLLPSFNDSHMHLLNYGYTRKMLNLTKYKSIKEAIDKATDFIETMSIPKGKWVLGRGWNQDYLEEKRFFTRADLDCISKEHPIVFTRTCGHIAVCNSKALSMIDKNLLENDNIDIEKGTFYEIAIERLNEVIDSPNIDEVKDMIIDTCSELLENGITSAQTDDFNALPDGDFRKVIAAYKELENEELLRVRIYEQCLLPSEEKLEEFLSLGYKTGKGSRFFKIGPLKLLVDGALGGRTALLNEPYSDDSTNTGICVYSQDELDKFTSYAHDNDIQIAIHAIGDKAMDMVIDAYEKIPNNTEENKMRHGIVHCQITNQEILNRLASNNIIAYIQPIFLDYDLHIVEERVGSRYSETYAFNTMKEKGVKICGGSDAPVVHFNPFENIYSAVTRKDLKGYPESGFLPKERLSLMDALKLFTINSSYSSFEEDVKGSLEIGKLADMIILDRDIFTIDEDEIKDIKVDMTVVDGKIVFKREGV